MMLAVFALMAGCAKQGDVFGDIGTNIASPSAMAVDVTLGRLYVVNSNSDVLYDSTQGSFQVYDITNPLAPTLVRTMQTLSFSGEMYLNTVTKQALVPNRYTADSQATEGRLYGFDVDEASQGFLNFTESSLGRDSYAIKCCYPENRAWISTTLNELQYVDLGGDMVAGSIPLTTTLSNGGEITYAEISHIAIIGNQAFLSRAWGGVMVVNLDEAGVSDVVPVDYFIADIDNPRGIATDGTLLYVVGEGPINDTWTTYLLILDPTTLTSTTTNTSTQYVDKDDDGILLALIQVGSYPQEVLLSTSYAFVTNMNDDTVSVIDLATRVLLKTITVGDEPFSLAVYTTPAGSDEYLYIGNTSSNTISIIDIPTLAVAATYQ